MFPRKALSFVVHYKNCSVDKRFVKPIGHGPVCKHDTAYSIAGYFLPMGQFESIVRLFDNTEYVVTM